ncbi:MAG: hypothetical protein R3B70_20865 [Polyangiaceae bacterium]
MSDKILSIADGFWNIRGSYKVGGILDVGTQASLVRRQSGKYVLIDAYTLSGEVKAKVDEITGGGKEIEAVLNTHPFHTMHVRAIHAAYPDAKLYGSARHLARFSDLPWEKERMEDEALHALFADDFDFSIPRGVDFISADEKVHFSTVLMVHRATKTAHVDDTLMYMRLPGVAALFGKKDMLSFHPTLSKALERRAGAVADFRKWAEELAESYKNVENLCAAHTAALIGRNYEGSPISERILKALDKVSGTLRSHEAKYG